MTNPIQTQAALQINLGNIYWSHPCGGPQTHLGTIPYTILFDLSVHLRYFLLRLLFSHSQALKRLKLPSVLTANANTAVLLFATCRNSNSLRSHPTKITSPPKSKPSNVAEPTLSPAFLPCIKAMLQTPPKRHYT